MMSVVLHSTAWRRYDDAIKIFRKRLDNFTNCPPDSFNARARAYYIGAAFFSKKSN